MKKSDLVAKLAEKSSVSRKDCATLVDLVFEEITNALAAGDNFSVVGFGTFSVKERAERVGVNPQKKGEKMVIPAMKVPAFKAGKALKEAVK